jgi:hypothetical protein
MTVTQIYIVYWEAVPLLPALFRKRHILASEPEVGKHIAFRKSNPGSLLQGGCYRQLRFGDGESSLRPRIGCLNTAAFSSTNPEGRRVVVIVLV